MNAQAYEAVRRLEEDLLRPEFRASREAIAALLADDFLEVGSSGRRYGKREILDVLSRESDFAASLSGFEARELMPGLVLATYRVTRERSGAAAEESLRSSLWRLQDGRWQILFHQGTRSA